MMAPDVNMAASSSSSSSSCSPSSSAITITTPGKSILKRPPPQQPSLFSRITRFLPTQAPASQNATNEESKPLKRAHFILPEIAIVYPISSINPPSTPNLKDEKRAIEDKEKERRKRVVRGSAGGQEFEEWWSMDKVESFYRECCAGCDEMPDPAIKAALKNTSPTHPRTVDLSGVQLTFTSASILSDVFSIEWGLRKLVFRECDLDDSILKPMLHALLIPGTLSFLSVASNRRLKTAAFRLIGAYVKNAKSLQFLDLSQNILDKKSIEYIVAGLETAPQTGLVSLRLDDCSLRPAALEVLCRAVRTSSLRNISLRHNRISVAGGVALALMIRDYPDVVPTPISAPPSPSATSTSFPTPSPASSVSNLSIVSPPSTPTPSVPNPLFVRSNPVPPPRHPSTVSMQTTYTPYMPRARRGKDVATATTNPLSPTGQHIPIITSSSQGGVTTRHPTPGGSGTASGDGYRHSSGPSAALLDKVRALDSLPRLGALKTLDLKGNDLRTGISYIAQVLKRNRTLKVLNLSENKLDVQCLVTIAEALKYNSSLETLDLNKNPCSGPGLEGIQSLRTAFTLNTALKRLFLSSTSMTSAGAIALAEFLPESTSLLHLDLTMNSLDIAGVMALSSGLKANHVMRCLDVNIPPGDEEFARMCREILNSCVRNTEEAERLSKASEGSNLQSGRGLRKGVWGMIEESELARSIRKGEEKRLESDILIRALRCVEQLKHVLSIQTSPQSTPKAVVSRTVGESRVVTSELASIIQETNNAERLEELLNVNDQLLNLLKKVPGPGKPILTLQSLDIAFKNTSSSSDGKLDGTPHINGRPSDHGEESSAASSSVEGFEDSPTTPKIDKGKGKAEPEPEEPEKVLSPRIRINDSEDEDEDGVPYEDALEVPGASPTDRSRSWVAEEGEVFRKGTVLLGPAEMEGEYAGEELRKELLEAMVERPPPRPLTDEFGTEVLIPGFGELPVAGDRSPISPMAASPTFDISTLKSPPKPYISRSKSSSNSSLNLISPISSPSTEYPETTLTPTSPTIGGRPP